MRWLIYFLLLRVTIVYSQVTTPNSYSKNLSFEHYTQDKGLSQGSGYVSEQFDDFMWFGTQDGLNRFDEHEFRVYKNKNLGSNYIQALLNDGNGHLWVGTSRGLAIYEALTDSFITFEEFIREVHPLTDASVRQLFMDQAGGIWILTDKIGVFYYDPNKKKAYTFPHFSTQLIDISETSDGNIYVATDYEIYHLDKTRIQSTPLHIPLPDLIPETVTIRAILSDYQNRLWIGTYEHGLYQTEILDHSLKAIEHFEVGNSSSNISSNEITRLFQDSKNQIWIGTRTGGISIYNPLYNHFTTVTHHAEDPNSLAVNYVLSFFEDVQNNVWVGLSGGGFDKYDPRKFQFELIRKKDVEPNSSLSDNMVFKIHKQDQYIYFGTQTGGLTRYDPSKKEYKIYKNIPGNSNSLPHNEIYDISSDRDGKIWLALGTGLCRYDPKTQFFESFSKNGENKLVYLYASEVIQSREEVWTGGQRGLFRLNLQNKQWINWAELPKLKAISDYVFRIIYEDSEKNVWLGTTGQGLYKFSSETGTVTHINQSFGLDCANIRCLFEDKNSLWVGTDCGAYVFNKEMNLIAHFTSQNGLPNDVVYGILKGDEKQYWLSSNA